MKYARILVIADETVPAFMDYYNPDVFKNIDLIISCGDLPARYLSFIATVFHGDVLYVPGNHDNGYEENPPFGCVNIDGKIYNWRGLRIMGLGGSMRYKDGPYQYTEKEMKRRYRKMAFQLWKNKGIDILVTHAPARHFHDGDDPCHQGFYTFIEILRKYQPKYFIHGHVHMTYGNYPRLSTFEENTMVINAYERFVIEVPLEDAPDSSQEPSKDVSEQSS